MAAYTKYPLLAALVRQWDGAGTLGVINRTAPEQEIFIDVEGRKGRETIELLGAGDQGVADLSAFQAYTIRAATYPADILWLETPLPISITNASAGVAAGGGAAGPGGGITLVHGGVFRPRPPHPP